jgi:hypothetical protein
MDQLDGQVVENLASWIAFSSTFLSRTLHRIYSRNRDSAVLALTVSSLNIWCHYTSDVRTSYAITRLRLSCWSWDISSHFPWEFLSSWTSFSTHVLRVSWRVHQRIIIPGPLTPLSHRLCFRMCRSVTLRFSPLSFALRDFLHVSSINSLLSILW